MYSSLVLGAVLAYASVVSSQQQCNGYSELCAKPYNSLTYVITHNSYGFASNPAANQLCPVNTQLDDGVRGLKLSAVTATTPTGDPANDIHLCHTSCKILDAGPAKDTLSSITSWLKSNPNEVLTIMWNNLGNFNASALAAAYADTGILDYSYTQPAGNQTWPTLQEMISSGKRVVNFLDEAPDQGQVPWLMPEYNFVFETPYNNTNEASFKCSIDRPQDPVDPPSMMYVMNHFLYGTFSSIEIPQPGTANTTNSDSLSKQAKTCTNTFGRQPNFLEVDFFNNGQTLQIAAQLNNVTYQPKTLACDQYQQQHQQQQSTSLATVLSATPIATLFTLALAFLLT